MVNLAGCTIPVCCGKPDPIKPIKRADIRITAVGDIMLGTNFPDDRLAPDDGAHLLKAITPILNSADITFGNLEGVLLEGGEAAKKCKNSTSCYVFRSPPHYAKYLKDAGFDVLSLANNHARDFGEEGRTASMQALDTAGLLHTGRVGDVVKFSHALIDAGADLVIGHGPHVPRALELYKKRLIAYSLGNFLTYQGIRITGVNGVAPILTLTLSADGRFKQGKIISARQYRPKGTLLDKKNKAAKIIKELTLADFPDTPLVFSKTGLITPRILPHNQPSVNNLKTTLAQ